MFTSSPRSHPSEWLKCSILSLQCMHMISMITNWEIQLYGKNLHFTMLQISEWSTFGRHVETLQHQAQGNITHWWSNMYRSEKGLCHKTRQIWGIWKLRPAYSPETPNLGQNRWCFVPCDLEIWWMTLENNRVLLLCCFKLCATFHSHRWIQTGVTVQKRPIWVKFDDF